MTCRFLLVGFVAILGALWWRQPASAIVINDYSPARHDRFTGGYPDAPLPNMNPAFIGLGYDWSGVGWLATSPTRGYALLGPNHVLYARHYPTPLGGVIHFQASDGSIHGFVVQSRSGPLPPDSPDPEKPSDLAIGVFAEPVPGDAGIAFYTILFKGYSTAAYLGMDLLQYGRSHVTGGSPRIGWNQIHGVFDDPSGSDIYYSTFLYDTVTPDRTQLFSGDSGSPSFFTTGTPGEMYLAGAHYATQAGEYGLDTMLPMMLPYVTRYMAETGDLPWVWTPITATWTGNVSSQWHVSANWLTGSVFADTFFSDGRVRVAASVLFDADSAARHAIQFDAERRVTGLTFRGTSDSTPFVLSGAGTLTIGEAGLRNEHPLPATIHNPISLRSSQRWDVGVGGLVATGPIQTGTSQSNPWLLLVDGPGHTALHGLISGTGSLGKYGGGTLALLGSQQWSDGSKVSVHQGTLLYHLASPPAIGRNNLLTVAHGATVELAGSTSALGNSADRVDLLVDGTLLVTGTNQIVNQVAGSGQVIVEGHLTIVLDDRWTSTAGSSGASASEPSSPTPIPGGFVVVPEPSTLVMLLGLAAVGAGAAWRRGRVSGPRARMRRPRRLHSPRIPQPR